LPLCLNCGTPITENYCPKCGQKKEVERLTWHTVVEEIVHFFSHIEKGFLYTSYRLLIRPDKVIGEYLEGKRKKYFKPIALYLIWVAIHLLANQLVTDLMHYENLRTGGFLLQEGETQAFIVKNSKLFGLLQLPVLSFFVWLIVSRPKLNFIETLVALIYVFAAIEILVFFQIIIIGLLFRTNFLTNAFLIQVQVVSSIWTFYCFVLFFKTKKIQLLVLRILLALVVAFLFNGEVTELIAEMILKMKY
jgi:hypothetical protein